MSLIEKKGNTALRSEIVAANFFNYLRRLDITQQKYAEDNCLDRTIVSKWKNGKSCMTPEQIYQAAEYLKITVNDLFYCEAEKKKLLILADDSYAPISAKRTFTLTRYDLGWNKSIGAAEVCALFLLIATGLSWLLFWSIPYSAILVPFAIIPVLMSVFRDECGVQETYTVSYLDRIFYRRSAGKPFSRFYVLLWILYSVTLVFCILNLYQHLNDRNSLMLVITVAIHAVIMVVAAILVLLPIGSYKRAFETELADDEMSGFVESFRAFIAAFLSLTFSATAYIFVYRAGYLLLFLQAVGSIAVYIAYRLLYREYGRYTLMYKEHGKEERVLYQAF